MKKGGAFKPVDTDQPYADGNYRSLGVADMAHAIRSGRPHRASGQLALHVLEAMEAFEKAAASGATVTLTTTVERPDPLSRSIANGVLQN